MDYQTYRRINIKSTSIGTAYYGLTILVVAVIPLYLLMTHGHLEVEKPSGVFFARPKDPKGFSELMCSERVMAAGVQCTAWDWLESVDSDSESFFIATFVKDRLERRTCGRSKVPCGGEKIWELINVSHYYIAGTERLLVNFEHRVINPSGDVHDSHDLIGFLSRKGHCGIHQPRHSSYKNFSAGKDTLRVLDLLEAAGVDLDADQCVGCRASEDGLGSTLRRWGVELDVTIYYSNLWPQNTMFRGFFPGETAYQYCVRHVPSVDGVRLIYTAGASPFLSYNGTEETRIVRRVYGIKAHIHITGDMGRPSWKAAITFLIGALTLLAQPWTLTEFYLSILPLVRKVPAWYDKEFVVESPLCK